MFYNKYMKKTQRINFAYFCLLALAMMLFFTPIQTVLAENDFAAPDYFSQQTVIENEVIIAKINIDCSIYSSTSIGSAEYLVKADSLIMVLEIDVENQDDVAFVLYENDNQQIFGYINKTKFDICTFEDINKDYYTFFSNVKIYKYPTTSSVCLGFLDTSIKITPLNTCADYVDNGGNNFFAIEYQNGICYVCSSDVSSLDGFDPVVIDSPQSEDKTTQLTAYFVIIICMLLATIFICYKISKKES